MISDISLYISNIQQPLFCIPVLFILWSAVDSIIEIPVQVCLVCLGFFFVVVCFQRCLQLEPYNEVCQYMKGLSHVAMGQFYEGIKAQTKVMLNDPLLGQKASSEYLKVKYLRGEISEHFIIIFKI